MNNKTIEIIVAPDGTTKVETKGFAGASCRDASRFIEQTLGQKTAEQNTAEFFQNTETQQTNSQSA